MTGASRSAGGLLRKIVAAVVLVPLAILLIALAVANRQFVTVSLDPFSVNPPAAAVTLPLFALIIVLLILGVLIGGVAAWLRQGGWRRTVRRLEREVRELRAEAGSLRRATAAPTNIPEVADPPERLRLQPPLR